MALMNNGMLTDCSLAATAADDGGVWTGVVCGGCVVVGRVGALLPVAATAFVRVFALLSVAAMAFVRVFALLSVAATAFVPLSVRVPMLVRAFARAFAPLSVRVPMLVRAPLFPASGHSSAKCYRSSAGVRQALQTPPNWVLDKS